MTTLAIESNAAETAASHRLTLAGDALADAARLIAVNGLLGESAARRRSRGLRPFAGRRRRAHRSARDCAARGKDRPMTSDPLTASTAAEWRAERHAADKLKSPFTRPQAASPSLVTPQSPEPKPIPLAPRIPEARRYPVAALGSVLSGAAQGIASRCQCAPALAAQAVLAVASLAHNGSRTSASPMGSPVR